MSLFGLFLFHHIGEYCVAGGADGSEAAKDGQADRADEANVHQLAVAKTGRPEIHVGRNRKSQLGPLTGIRKKLPDEDAEELFNFIKTKIAAT